MKVEDKLTKVFQAMPDGVSISRLSDGMFLYVNPGLAKYAKYPVEKIVGRTVSDLNLWGNPEERAKLVKKLEIEGEVRNFEIELQTIDGESLSMSMSASLIEIDGEKCMVSLTRDTTESKRMEEALRTSEERFRDLVNLLPQTIYEADMEGNIIFINSSGLNTFGRIAEDTYGKTNIQDFVIPNDKERGIDNLQNILKGEMTAPNEYTMLKKDGSTFPAIIYSSPIIRGGNVAGARGLVIDITERKRAEDALHIEKQFSDMAISSLPGIFFIHDEHGKFLRWNHNLEEISGYTSDEIAKRHPPDFIQAKDQPIIKERISEAFELGESDAESNLLTKDGKIIPYYFTGKRIVLDGVPCLIGMGIDITERKRAEENLENLTKQILIKQKVLLELAKEDFINLETSFKRIVETDAEQLKVSRVSVWLYNHDHTEIICQCLYQDGEIINQGEMILSSNQFPRYFEALEQSSTISANDAHNDLRTSEFSKDYLSPLGITSMMDVPIRLQGSTIGIVCHEQVGPMREWSVPDEDFARSIAEMCTLSLQTAERKQAEEALNESENKYRTLFEQSADALLIIEGDTFVDCNMATVKIFGFENKEEFTGVHPSEISPEKQFDGRSSIDKANELMSIAYEQGSYRFEWDHMRKNGEIFPAEVLLTAVPLGDKKFLHGVIRDITERKQAEDELLQYQMQLRALASEITIAEEQERRRIAIDLHDYIIQDLGLAKIKLGELVQRLSTDDSLPLAVETRELIEGIIKETRSLVFDLSLPVLYDLGYVAAIKWLAEQTERKLNIPCDVQDDGQPKPMNNEMQVLLFKAVRELMNNIGKHAHANEVNILINRVNGQINTSVQDDGVGFDPAHIELYRGETLKFGLFGIKERLNLLNGFVKISSAPGSGTNITLTAPLEIDD